MIFRDNTQKKIWGKQVLLLIASVSTGKSINRAMDCLKYYNGNLVGIASIFSAIKENNGTAIHALFTEKDLPDYMTYTSSECPMCKSGQKVDALVISFGYSKILLVTSFSIKITLKGRNLTSAPFSFAKMRRDDLMSSTLLITLLCQ